MQPDGNLKLDEKGYVLYNKPVYLIQKGDYITINIASSNPSILGMMSGFTSQGNQVNLSTANGIYVRDNGAIELPRLGYIHVEGLTIEEVRKAIQDKFYEIYNPEGTYIDVNLVRIEYTIVGEAGNQVNIVNKRDFTIIDALARAGGAENIYANLKEVRIIRSTPEGTKQSIVDVRHESIMNSEYYWVQNNDIIVINPRKAKIWGVGLNPLSIVTTTMVSIATILGVFYFFKNL